MNATRDRHELQAGCARCGREGAEPGGAEPVGAPGPGPAVQVLGYFEHHLDGDPVNVGPSAERLISLLAVHRAPVSRPRAAAMLWPVANADRAAANLRSALWRLQRCSQGLVVSRGERLQLSGAVTVDLWAGIALAQQILDDDLELNAVEDLGARMRGLLFQDLLPEYTDEPWLLEHRERFRQLRLHALELLCRQLARRGWSGLAIEAGMSAIHADPYRESAHRALIDVHLAEGNRWEAMRQFEECRRLLRDDLGIAPSPHLLSGLGA